MKKICAFIFVLCYVVSTAVVHGATVEMDGKKLECEKSSTSLYRCADGDGKIIVINGDRGFGAVTQKDGVVLLKNVSKVTDEGKVLFLESNQQKFQDSKANRIISASSVVGALKKSQDPDAKELVAKSENYLSKEGTLGSQLNVTLNGSTNSYKCDKGTNRRQTETEKENNRPKPVCGYYACTGSDPAEKVLMYLPDPATALSLSSAKILTMKNGQANLIQGDFRVTDNSNALVADLPHRESEEEIMARYQGDTANELSPDLFRPSKYDQSKSSFSYLKSYAEGGFNDYGLMDACESENVKSLFTEKNRIAGDMQASIAEAELIEYLKMIDGNIHSFYVDRTKGMALGCMYQDKILDQGVLGNLDHLNAISRTKPVKKYLSITEVQSLFTEAQNMADIPFGYKYDGCYARAHLMARRFEEKGIDVQKVWIKGELSVPNTDIEWNYHVAPVVEVRMEDGHIEKFVIDPSLTDKAVPVDDWVATMDRHTESPVMKTTFPFPANGMDFQRTVVAISPTDVFAPTDMNEMTEDQKMSTSIEVLQDFTRVLEDQRSLNQEFRL